MESDMEYPGNKAMNDAKATGVKQKPNFHTAE
jgi:hypothetical protein